MKWTRLVKSEINKKETYYVFDLEDEEIVSPHFDSLEKANETLCLYAGILKEEIEDYLQSEESRYEIRSSK